MTWCALAVKDQSPEDSCSRVTFSKLNFTKMLLGTGGSQCLVPQMWQRHRSLCDPPLWQVLSMPHRVVFQRNDERWVRVQ